MEDIVRSIETARTIMEGWTGSTEEAEAVKEGLSNPNVTAGLKVNPNDFNPTVSKETAEDNIRAYVEQRMKFTPNLMSFAVKLSKADERAKKKIGDIIGSVAIYTWRDKESNNKVGSVALWFLEQCSGLGYGSEVWRKCCETIFNELGCDVIEDRCVETNKGSRALQKKFGAEEVGTNNEYYDAKDARVIEIITRLTKENFAAACRKIDGDKEIGQFNLR